MIRFATFSTHQMALSQMMDTQNRLFSSQMQISSGKVSRNYAGIAIESRRLVNLENAVTGVNGFIRIIDVTESRLQLMENAVVGTFDLASQFRDLLVNALNIDNASLLTLNQRAEDMLQELTGALNVQQDNRFLFSGSRIDTAPIDVSVLLATSVPLVNAVEFTGAATDSGTGITGLTGISGVQVDSGATDDAFQVEFDSGSNTFTVTNLNGGASNTAVISSVPAAGETTDISFSVGGENFVLTIDENFDLGTSIATDTITGNVAAGAGVFGTITLTGTTGDTSIINDNAIETSGTANNATLTLSSSDGDFVATGINLSVDGSTVPVTLTNATTGATITLSVDVTTALDDTAIGDADTEIQLNDFLENVAASDGSVNVEDARPGDPGYDSTAPGYYEGDSDTLGVRIDRNATVDYGVTADESGFEKLFRALYMVLNVTVTSGNIDTDTLESALGLAIEAIEEIPDIRSMIGSDRLMLEKMKVRHQDFIVFTGEAINKIETVDVAAAVSRMSIDQVMLEASYMLTARLSQLSLANFLR